MPHSQFRRAEQAPSDEGEEDELEPLEDKTEALTLRSKKTDRAQKKQQLRAAKKQSKPAPRGLLLDLPYELLLEILYLLRPSDLFNLRRAGKGYDAFITSEENRIALHVVSWRYSCLVQCFRLPVLIHDIQHRQQQRQDSNDNDDEYEENDDVDIVPILRSPERQDRLGIHKRPYSHVLPPDPAEVCTCLTCVLRWSALCLIVDFAHWQNDLDRGEPIPHWSRSEPVPEWNRQLLARNADVVRKALSLHRDPETSPGGVAGAEVGGLWHARLLEAHLDSTVRAIRRHAANKGNKRRRFAMTASDAASGTDAFLERSGPPTFDFPFHRDNYYMLEAYLPNRAWIEDMEKWVYVPASQHDYDIRQVLRWAVDMRGVRGKLVVEAASDEGQVAAVAR
ncbi:hypothetical protein PG993_008840 [Apiospora rasikravindrae]|uniref:F-box domain-containing protein n=1 Tax=Apiospora rasikravindrae TaxID=990691 RepID=A0ABR1SPG2_9PEZI